MDHIPLYLVALIVAIVSAPTKTTSSLTKTYRVASWDLSTTTADSWRHRLTRAFRACANFLWVHRWQTAAIACAILLLLAPDALQAHTHGVSLAVVAGVPGAILQQETRLRELQVKAKTLLETQMRACEDHEVKDDAGKVVAKGRFRTDEEKAAVQAILDEAKPIKARIDAAKSDANMLEELDRLTAGMQAAQSQQQPGQRRQGGLKSLGQQFVESDAYKFARQGGNRQGLWTSPFAELTGIELFGATLTEASGGAALLVPDYRPGILEYLQRQLVVADLIAPGTTDGTSVSYMVESAPTNAAATVAEGTAKPESTLVFTARTDTVRKIATWLPVTDEMLEDVSQIRSYIDGRLRLFVQLAEDDQLLNGDGIAPNIEGIRVRSGLQADQARGSDTNMDAIRKQITKILVNALIQADAIVMHPTNWETIELAKDANGQYYGSGPFAAPGVPRLWGLPVAVTVAMTLGTALPGAFRLGAQFFRKGGLTTAASNSHQDYFVKNLTAIRAEERGALAVYRPGAFGEVTGLV